MSENVKIDPDVTVPIVYGRPRYLAPILTVAAAGALLAAVIGYLTYGRVDSASREDVLANRAVTQRLAAAEQRRDAENESHRERNEEAHACIAELIEELLDRTGTRLDIDFGIPEPCDAWVGAGAVPVTTTTTEVPRARRTPTTRRAPRTTTTTRPRGSTPTTARPTPPTTACPTVQVADTCATLP